MQAQLRLLLLLLIICLERVASHQPAMFTWEPDLTPTRYIEESHPTKQGLTSSLPCPVDPERQVTPNLLLLFPVRPGQGMNEQDEEWSASKRLRRTISKTGLAPHTGKFPVNGADEPSDETSLNSSMLKGKAQVSVAGLASPVRDPPEKIGQQKTISQRATYWSPDMNKLRPNRQLVSSEITMNQIHRLDLSRIQPLLEAGGNSAAEAATGCQENSSHDPSIYLLKGKAQSGNYGLTSDNHYKPPVYRQRKLTIPRPLIRTLDIDTLQLYKHPQGRTTTNTFLHSDTSPMQSLQKVTELEDDAWSQWSRNAQVSQYYSSQILNWSPPVISPQVAFATDLMVKEFENTLIGIPSGIELIKMQNSHMIFVPFVYKLMMRPMRARNWYRVLLVWRNLWNFSDMFTDKPNLCRNRSLTRFLWISDFISEATIPQLFEYQHGKGMRSLCGSRMIRVIKILSDCHGPEGLNDSTRHSLFTLSDFLMRECATRNHNASHEPILERLRLTAQSIIGSLEEVPEAIKVEDWRASHESLLKNGLGTDKESLHDFKVVPPLVQRRINLILKLVLKIDLTIFSAASSLPLISDFNYYNWIKELADILNNTKNRLSFYAELPGNFLPEKIHGFFERKIKHEAL
ncbi:hypothetical protein MJO29_010657 [Puccinia striiformis f. sp. tritici]|nr:hypothetical protein MJO29_010657 [Puccinia striiformis f. sp. tritici]